MKSEFYMTRKGLARLKKIHSRKGWWQDTFNDWWGNERSTRDYVKCDKKREEKMNRVRNLI